MVTFVEKRNRVFRIPQKCLFNRKTFSTRHSASSWLSEDIESDGFAYAGIDGRMTGIVHGRQGMSHRCHTYLESRMLKNAIKLAGAHQIVEAIDQFTQADRAYVQSRE